MAEFALSVATPERQLVDAPATDALIPALDGYIDVLPGHAPLLSELTSGAMTYTSRGQTHHLAIMGGFVEVLSDRVRVLANAALRKEEIDSARAQERLAQARQDIQKPPMENPTPEQWDDLLDAAKRAQAEVDTAAK
jgi:F-type H+-transporting ATPase subunit epsilon